MSLFFSSCLSVCRYPSQPDVEEVHVNDPQNDFDESDSDTTEGDDTISKGQSRYMLPRRKLTRVEELTWMEPFMKQLWPKIDSALHKIMKETVEPKIQDKVPLPLKGLTFTKFTLGKTTPTVGPVTIWDAPCLRAEEANRGIELHVDISLESPVDVELAVGALVAGIKSVTLQGTLVLRLDPLLDRSPILGGLVIYFLDPPVLDLHFTKLAELASELDFSERMITNLLEKLIARRLVLPNVWFRPFLKDEEVVDTATLRDPKPVGVLRVTAIEAKDLYANDINLFTDRTSDPYVRIRLADDEWKSKHREGTCNPKWVVDPDALANGDVTVSEEERHDFLVYDVGQTLRIEVYDWNEFQSDVLIGRSIHISVQDALAKSRKWIELKQKDDKPGGHLQMQFDWLKVVQESAGPLNQEDDACMVRLKIDEIYVPEDVDLLYAKVEVKFQEALKASTPDTHLTSHAVVTETGISSDGEKEKRLDVEYVLCFQVSRTAAETEPLQISIISNEKVVVATGELDLREVVAEGGTKEWPQEDPMLLKRPREDKNVIFGFESSNPTQDEENKAPPLRAEVAVSVMGLVPVPTKTAIAHMRKRRMQSPKAFPTSSSTFSHTIRSFARTADEQPLVNRDTTKCTGSVESLDWFNTFFARLWPKIAAYVQKLMEDVEGNVTQRMQAALPSMLKGMYFSKFKLGSKSPQFGPIKISEAPPRWKDGKDSPDIMQGSEIRLGVRLDSESEIELSVMKMKVGIHRLQVRGEIALRFEPLLGQTPVLGGLVISFLNPPKLAMEYKFLASLVGNSTLEPTVKSAIDRALAKALVMPNVISIPIGSEEKGVDRALLRSPRPLGLIRIRVKAAQGLPDGHLHFLSKQQSNPYMRVRVADDEWESSCAVGCNPTWLESDSHCFWYYDLRQTVHLEVLDQGRFNPKHSLAIAKPVLVSLAAENSGKPVELFAPVASLDEVSDEPCGTLEIECELLQPKAGVRPSCELCMLRIKVDEIYVPQDFPQPVAFLARCGDSEKTSPFVVPKVQPAGQDSSSKLPLDRQPVALPTECVLHLLVKKEDLSTHALELEIINRKPREVLASKDLELKQFWDRGIFKRVWGLEKQALLNLRGEGIKCQAKMELQISGLDPPNNRVRRALPRMNTVIDRDKPRCGCTYCKLKCESWYLLVFSGNALLEGAACLIASLSGFILIFFMAVFGPRHKYQELPSGADEGDDEMHHAPETVYEGGDTTRSSKERTSPLRVEQPPRPVSVDFAGLSHGLAGFRMESGSNYPSPNKEVTPTRAFTKDRDRTRAYTMHQTIH